MIFLIQTPSLITPTHNCDWQLGKKALLRYCEVTRQDLSYWCFLEGFTLSTVTSCLNSETEPANDKVESSCHRRNRKHKMSICSEKLNKTFQGQLRYIFLSLERLTLKELQNAQKFRTCLLFQVLPILHQNDLSKTRKAKEYSLERLELAKKASETSTNSIN